MTSLDFGALVCQNLDKTYLGRTGKVQALHDVTFRVAPGEFVCIVGPSGCGKTTLLKMIAGLVQPTAGRIVFPFALPGSTPQRDLVFQDHGLFPWMTTLDNAAFGLEMHGVSKRDRLSRARSLLRQIGLDAFCDHYPHELSAGMRQRVGVARAFLSDPDILLMDEPFGALDAQTKILLQEELLRLWKSNPKSVVFVTHDIEEAVVLADRILVMTGRPGQIRDDISIPIPRPRDPASRDAPMIAEVKWRIWKMLEQEVRRDLQVAND